jgi:chromosome segregation ATPase
MPSVLHGVLHNRVQNEALQKQVYQLQQQVAQLSQNNINLVQALAEKDAKLTALETARTTWEAEKQQLEASVVAASAAAVDSVQAELKAELQAQRKEAIHATSALYKHAQRTVKAACKRHRLESTDGADSSSSPKQQRLYADSGESKLHIYLPHGCT